MKPAVPQPDERHTEAFTALSLRVCSRREKSAYFLHREPADIMVYEVFLDTRQDLLHTIVGVVEAIAQRGGERRRAFSFSKSHARCMSDNGVWRRWDEPFI